jgi:hypothetical protein
LTPAPPIVLPANTPPALAQQIWQAALGQALQNQNPAVQVEYTNRNAVIESTRVASEHKTEGKITASTQPGGQIQISIVNSYARWGTIPEPSIAQESADSSEQPAVGGGTQDNGQGGGSAV